MDVPESPPFYIKMPGLWYLGLSFHFWMLPIFWLQVGSRAFFGIDASAELLLLVAVATNVIYSLFFTRMTAYRKRWRAYLLVTALIRLLPVIVSVAYLFGLAMHRSGGDEFGLGLGLITRIAAVLGAVLLFGIESDLRRQGFAKVPLTTIE